MPSQTICMGNKQLRVKNTNFKKHLQKGASFFRPPLTFYWGVDDRGHTIFCIYGADFFGFIDITPCRILCFVV